MELFLALLLVVMWVVVVSGVAILFRAELQSGVGAIVQKMRRGGSASNSTSASPLKNTICYLHTREECARFVSDIRSLGSDLQWITITRQASSGGYFATSITAGYLEHVARVYLSPQLLTSLTRREWQCWESELLRAGRGSRDEAKGDAQSEDPDHVPYAYVRRRADLEYKHVPDYKDLIADGDVDSGPYG